MDVLEREQLAPQRALEHWYYQAKFKLLIEALTSVGCLQSETRIADVGCGIGLFLTFLEQTGYAKPEQLLGIDPAYTTATNAIGGGAQIFPTWPKDEAVDLALLMDVLEHTPDDLAVLREAADHVQCGGYVFITVPAFSWLYSAHDRFLGHFRRYTARSLESVIRKCGALEVVHLHYYYASILPLAVPWRLARRSGSVRACSDLKELPGWLNALLRMVTRAELKVAPRNRLAGLSVVALCRKVSAGTISNASALARQIEPRFGVAA